MFAGCSYDEGITQKSVDASITTAINNQVMPKITEAKTVADAAKKSADEKTTKEYVDAKFAAIPAGQNYSTQIAALESRVAALEAKLVANPVISATNDVIISLYKDVSNPLYTSGDYTWWIKIKNGYAEYKKIFLNAAISATGSTLATVNTTDTYMYAPDLVGGMSTPTTPAGRFSMNFVPSTGVSCSLIGANSQGYVIVKGGTEVVVPITLRLVYTGTAATQWSDVSWSRTVLNYP
jgi:hypothetical protein